MRKILLISSLVLVLSACGLKSSSDYSSLYNKHIHSQMVAIEDMIKSLGLYKQEQSVGALQAAINVGPMMSGSLSLEHDAKVNGRDADLLLKNVRLAYDSMMGSGSLSLDKFGLVSKSGDAYFLFDGLKDSGILTDEIRTIVNKYTNTWLSWTQADMKKSLSGASEEEILSNTMVENLSKMTLDDVEKYLTKYQLLKQTADIGMSGSIHMYAVELDREATLGLISQVTQDLTSSGLSDTDKKDIQDGLAALTFSGTLGFDEGKADVAALHLVITESGSTSPAGVLDMSTNKDNTQLVLTSSATESKVTLTLAKKENRNEIQATVTEGGVEMGKMAGYIEKNGDKLKELSLDITAQGVTVAMKHTVKDDGKFEGKLTLPVGTITWNGALTGKKLTGLSLKGTMPMGSISMDLVPQGDKVTGPLMVKEGSNTLLNANIGLLIDEGKFGMSVDVLANEGTDTTPQAHVELNITAKSSPFNGSVGVPSPTKPLQDLLNELEKLAPKDSFAPVDDADMGMSPDYMIDEPSMNEMTDSEQQ